MIFPPRPKGIERDDTEHGRLYYTADDLRRYALQCVEEYKRCNPDGDKCERVNPLKSATPRGAVVDELMRGFGK